MGLMLRPTLERTGKHVWSVRVPVAGVEGMQIAHTGPDPESTIVAAAAGLDAQWCQQCAGTGTSRRWSGDGQPTPCEACNGTGAAER